MSGTERPDRRSFGPMDTDIAHHVGRIERDGYTVVDGAIEPDLCDELLRKVDDVVATSGIEPAGNRFEGARTVRVYNLLAHGPVFSRVPVHATILPIVERVLDAGCLVSSLSSIDIGPGEVAQPLHADDQLIPLPRPHPPTVCNTMWALTDFTDENGATRIAPGTHLSVDTPRADVDHETIPATMAKGSVLIWHGSLWHGGGANLSSHRRVGIAMNYCAGYIRQQENQQLGLSPDLVAGFEPRLQELVGYGIYQGLIGHIDKRSPAELLGGGSGNGMIWDRVRP
jgi:ectoine hydroxylase-related dioxygenase (phytanoyl-CoA dioxygenase family)